MVSKKVKIKNSTIDSFTLFRVNKILLNFSHIKSFNFFHNFDEIFLMRGCSIGLFNKFYGCGKSSKLTMDKKSKIDNFNYFDLTDSIEIKKNIQIKSFCQFWTHGYTSSRIIKSEKIRIENSSIVNSSSIISTGVNIGENSIIEIGTIVTKNVPKNTFVNHKIIKK